MSSDWRVSQFEYPSVMSATDDRSGGEERLWAIEPDPKQKQEQSLREAQAREIGRVEGESKAKVQFEEALRKEREQLAEALKTFAVERSRYFEEIEGEVVELALSIARKVLHREAQVDPELLMGLVRYTLEKLQDGTHVKLRVHPTRISAWDPVFTTENLEVAGDSRLDLATCVVETELGTTAVNVDSQLKEIEQGLMDLLSHRPEAT